MGIKLQIQADILAIKKKIAALTSPHVLIKRDGILVLEKDAAELIKSKLAEQEEDLLQLEHIIRANIIPPLYWSPVTKQIYYPSADECTHLTSPETHSLFCAKESRKKTGLKQSQYTLFQSNGRFIVRFSVENQSTGLYARGGFSKVKKAFIDNKATPQYALKVFNEKLRAYPTQETRMAMRSAFCYKLLGYEGYAFRHKEKQYLLSTWLTGTPLEEYSEDELSALSVSQRFFLALCLINKIALLHQHGIIHCDIKPANILLSDNETLHLLDFDGARLEEEYSGLNCHAIYSQAFLDAESVVTAMTHFKMLYKKLNKKSDLFALGLTLTFLFPDVLSPSYETHWYGNKRSVITYESIALSKGPMYYANHQLARLLMSLCAHDAKLRPANINEVSQLVLKLLPHYAKTTPRTLPCIPLKNEEKIRSTGKEAFAAIDKELLFFNARRTKAEKISARMAKPSASKTNNSFYLLAGAGLTMAALVVLWVGSRTRNHSVTTTGKIFALGGGVVLSYGLCPWLS